MPCAAGHESRHDARGHQAARLVVLVQQQVADGLAGGHLPENRAGLFPIEPAQHVGGHVRRAQVEDGGHSLGPDVPGHTCRIRRRQVGECLGGHLSVRHRQQRAPQIGLEIFEHSGAVWRP